MKTSRQLLVMASCAALSVSAFAAPTTYEFETVTGMKLDGDVPSITGVLRNTTTPTTVPFNDHTNVSYRYVVNRCVPVFLTMMEKPGKYYLTLVVDPANTAVGLVSCSLDIR